jgi:hypothetical protein
MDFLKRFLHVTQFVIDVNRLFETFNCIYSMPAGPRLHPETTHSKGDCSGNA